MLNSLSHNAHDQLSLSSRFPPGDAPRGEDGDGERDCFWARAGDLEAERLLERDKDLQTNTNDLILNQLLWNCE